MARRPPVFFNTESADFFSALIFLQLGTSSEKQGTGSAALERHVQMHMSGHPFIQQIRCVCKKYIVSPLPLLKSEVDYNIIFHTSYHCSYCTKGRRGFSTSQSYKFETQVKSTTTRGKNDNSTAEEGDTRCCT